MRILVAGGAGLIGSTICRHLLRRGDEVVCVDNLITGSKENVESLVRHRSFTWVLADITEHVPVAGRFDAVINLASPASPVDFGPLSVEILQAGSRGVTNLLDLARSSGARFLQASTGEVYGDPLVHPQPETYWGNVNPTGPRSAYDEAERFAEALTLAYHRRYGTEVRVARIFNTYGPGFRPDDGRSMSNFIIQALSNRPITVHGDGSQTRSFCYVDDLVRGLLALLQSNLSGPVNLGNDDERPVLEVAQLVKRVCGSSSEIVFEPRPADDPGRRRPDLALSRTALSWWPETSLHLGVQHTADWLRYRVASTPLSG